VKDRREDPRANRPTVFPFLRYDDAGRALQWLEQAFGFRRKNVVPGNGGTIAHAEMAFGAGVVAFSSSKDDELGIKTPKSMGAVNQGIYVFVEDLEEHFARARDAGAVIVRGPEETYYGSREYTARDFEGNLWAFGTYQMAAETQGESLDATAPVSARALDRAGCPSVRNSRIARWP
jgi:uncharacterized glyoxalase superfamily protein PhnB